MVFTLYFSMAMLLIVTFVCIPKNLHRQEYAFVWMAVVVVFITAIDTASPRNSFYFKVTDQPLPYVAQRMWELLIIPLVLLLYLNGAGVLKTWWSKMAAVISCLLVLYGLEALALFFKLIQYVEWKPWWSPIAWLVAIVYAMMLQKGMRKLLRREGKVQ